MIFVRFTILLMLFSGNLKASEFSSREVFNKLLKGFYKNEIHKCNYVNKSWSTGFEGYPYGMVLNSSAFKNILVFSSLSFLNNIRSYHDNRENNLFHLVFLFSTENGGQSVRC